MRCNVLRLDNGPGCGFTNDVRQISTEPHGSGRGEVGCARVAGCQRMSSATLPPDMSKHKLEAKEYILARTAQNADSAWIISDLQDQQSRYRIDGD